MRKGLKSNLSEKRSFESESSAFFLKSNLSEKRSFESESSAFFLKSNLDWHKFFSNAETSGYGQFFAFLSCFRVVIVIVIVIRCRFFGTT